ncbi:hypothetical protein K458DRAFT_418772 [Lentithecium fluviatile CBS 122367]|uniref:Uncharacterized protein n=1 Tax=Lentithecium fluviatile CBS 122367 TaxID=1168545 RepID=A0A6G1IZV2_9PLEO|nr:hypothetical protein K458DRAFT_418772 [Lentithecium fluviatile CBS 122367]
MKSTFSLLIAAVFTSALPSAAPTPGQPFYLKVVSDNALLSDAVLRDNNTYDLGITPPPYYSNPPYGDFPSPVSVSSTNASELIVSPTNPHPGPISGRLALVSAGEGDWTLSKAFPQPGEAWNVGPGKEGAVVRVYGWGFVDGEGVVGTVLRWVDGIKGRWIAVRTVVAPWEGAPYERWVLHWREASVGAPSPPVEYVDVDLKVSWTS